MPPPSPTGTPEESPGADGRLSPGLGGEVPGDIHDLSRSQFRGCRKGLQGASEPHDRYIYYYYYLVVGADFPTLVQMFDLLFNVKSMQNFNWFGCLTFTEVFTLNRAEEELKMVFDWFL